MQATGFAPFGQTNPPQPAPTSFNPFTSQNGSLGTNPFPTSSGTNPFPSTGQTMNPFPVVTNANPFTALSNNSLPNAASPNPFPSTNLNPFPAQGQTAPQPFSFASSTQPTSSNTTIPAPTSTFAAPAPAFVPARPASTPLAQTSPPPQPLKSHQTGSRNPFGVPKAPLPPPVPRAPTLFELATGVAHPQPQSQSPVQVKPQPTGLPTTTFASVASSFITGAPNGTASAQAPQQMQMTSSLTSLGSSSTATSIPTSLTAATATGSISESLFSSFGGQPTGSTALSSQPTGAPLRPQTTGFNAGVKAFKPTSSFGASLLEALPPIPQSEPTTPALNAASAAQSAPSGVGAPAGVGLGASLNGVSLPTINTAGTSGGAGLGGSSSLGTQPTGVPIGGAGLGGFTTLGGGGSSLGVGLRPQATGVGVGLGAVNPFRASVLAPSVGAGTGAFPAFGGTSNINAGTGLFAQPTGVPSFGQNPFVGAQTDPSKQQNGVASLI